MAELVIATRNQGKVAELQAMLAGQGVNVHSLADFPDAPEVEEGEESFVANALKKAREIAAVTDLPTLADDSGLEVDALDGAPGVISARYGGPGLDDPGRCSYLLAQLAVKGLSSSPARFRCVAALVLPSGREVVCDAAWEGQVAGPPRGANGFGYDPIFTGHGQTQTAAQLPAAVKNELSHRGQALAKLRQALEAEPGLLG